MSSKNHTASYCPQPAPDRRGAETHAPRRPQLPPLLQVGNVILSSELLTECFCCDLEACRGICCVEGEAGAPVTLDEVAALEEVLDACAKGCCDIAAMAGQLNMSTATFQRKFKQTFHETAGQWLLDRKAERIVRQLKTTSLSFDQICFENGFSSLAYFSNFCKRVFGKTPTQLRNEAF